MIVFQMTIAIFLAAILATALSRKLHLPLELTLLVGSIGLSLIPGVPHLRVNSDIIFFIVLPPILFAAAYFTSWSEFKRNIRPISMLAFGLVIFTVCGMALVVKWLIPSLAWPMAFLFGAIVSPPDASAAATVTRKVGLPRRLQSILEGESLINDATALVCYRFALAALVSGEFYFWKSLGEFFLVGLGGIVVGLAITHLTMRLLLYIQDASAEALLTVVTAFMCYFAADALNLSGVIATVAGGLYAGRTLPRWAGPETHVEAKALWNVVLLAANALVFTLIGLELPTILKGIKGFHIDQLCIWALILTCAVIALRFVWVFPVSWLARVFIPGFAKRNPMPSLGEIVVIAWTGMRGIVSLAAALALPTMSSDGTPLAERPLIVFLAYAVILLTLIIPTITLPSLLRLLQIENGSESESDEVRARLAMSQAALSHLSQLQQDDKYDEALLSELDRSYQRQIRRFAPNLENNAYSVLDPTEQKSRALLLELLELERGVLHQLRSRGDLHDEVYHQLGAELDLEALRIRRNKRPI